MPCHVLPCRVCLTTPAMGKQVVPYALVICLTFLAVKMPGWWAGFDGPPTAVHCWWHATASSRCTDVTVERSTVSWRRSCYSARSSLGQLGVRAPMCAVGAFEAAGALHVRRCTSAHGTDGLLCCVLLSIQCGEAVVCFVLILCDLHGVLLLFILCGQASS